jgi:hypothetical protein
MLKKAISGTWLWFSGSKHVCAIDQRSERQGKSQKNSPGKGEQELLLVWDREWAIDVQRRGSAAPGVRSEGLTIAGQAGDGQTQVLLAYR